MTKAAKPDHKAAFIGLRAGLAPTLHAASLLPHPVWRPGCDKDNAQYAAEYLAPPAPDGIRRVSLLYSPAVKGWHVEGVFMPCLDAAERLTHAANLGPNWIDALQGLPMRQNSLVPWRKRLFWRSLIKRQLRFDAIGAPRNLDATLTAALNGWPAFWASLTRPGTV